MNVIQPGKKLMRSLARIRVPIHARQLSLPKGKSITCMNNSPQIDMRISKLSFELMV
jgi:hypothetical protein